MVRQHLENKVTLSYFKNNKDTNFQYKETTNSPKKINAVINGEKNDLLLAEEF